MPTYPSIYRFRVLAAAVMASVSIYLFSASLGMDVLKSSEVLADIYPENMNDYASRLTLKRNFKTSCSGSLPIRSIWSGIRFVRLFWRSLYSSCHLR